MTKERRSLAAGTRSAPEPDRVQEQQFVYSGAAQSRPVVVSRVPLTTRIRSDYAQALKRASLERELEGAQPHTVQEILEQALEPWLRTHGYLP